LSSDYCEAIVPCDDTTCFEYCQNHNYKNFQTYCTMGKVYPICCCRVPDEGTTPPPIVPPPPPPPPPP
jgi:hypothetical protein